MDFEKAVARLEEIIRILESGDAKFNDALSLYEEGAGISKYLSETFKKAQGKISVIRDDLGKIIEESFE